MNVIDDATRGKLTPSQCTPLIALHVRPRRDVHGFTWPRNRMAGDYSLAPSNRPHHVSFFPTIEPYGPRGGGFLKHRC